ncbi:MAG: hypothetical protein DRN95_05575 [Candidatus Hydrothermarchaeota archaeon]|nr:MAG: hypothetical protein DRN95_05575 [Candidatus Hydrothermarchaeota archaeon]
MHKIKDIITPRDEVLKGSFQGVIQTHKIDTKEVRLENNPKEFLNITYPSSAIKRALERINEKLSGRSNQGGFLLVGPYGSGKSHTLITLFHLFNNSTLAKNWGKQWRIDLELPERSRSVVVSTRRYDVDHLWEPIFNLLGRNDLLNEIKRFPTTDQIEEAVGNEPVAIFIDEIENWYGAFDPDKHSHLIEQNETFLEHLLEVAADPKRKLFVFITFLEEKEGLKKIFNRTKPTRVDVSPIEDREKMILHRLFERVEDVDSSKIETVVETFINAYSEPIKIDNIQSYKHRMIRTYPFHPLLLDTLFQIYEAATERQDVRGMLNVLADAVKDTYEIKPLILLSEIDENDFRGMDLKLIEKYEYDLTRVQDIKHAREIMKSILIFTLNEKTHGATESDILLSIFSPAEGDPLTSILIDIENIYGKPHYLHKENGTYLFKHDLNIYALLEKEKKDIEDKVVREKIAKILREDVFENTPYIYGFDEIPDNNKTKIIIIPDSWGTDEELKSKLNEFYKGKTWQNTFILVLPDLKTIFTFEILEKGKRLKASENLLGQVKDEEKGKLKEIIKEERKGIANRIKEYYGYIVKWVERDGELTYRLINVSADINNIKDKSKSDPDLCGDWIVKDIEDNPNGKMIEEIINDFRKYRKYPFILDEDVIYNSIRTLHRDKRLIIQGERGKFYIDEIPRSLEPSFYILHPKYVPVGKTTQETEVEVDIEGIDESESEIETTEIPLARKEKLRLPLIGNSPRVILSQVEARTSEKDEFEEINIKYTFKQPISKQNIMKFIKQLPSIEESEIEAVINLWREKDEV